MEEKQPYGKAIQTSRKSRRIDKQIDRRIIKELDRQKGRKKERDMERLGKRGRPQRRHYHSSLSGCKDADQTGSRQKRTETERNRNKEKDKRTNKYERAVLCLERSRHTSKTPASQCRSTLTDPLGTFPLQEPFQEPRPMLVLGAVVYLQYFFCCFLKKWTLAYFSVWEKLLW